MSPELVTLVGSIAAFCTTVAFLPQVLRVWRTGQVEQLAFGTFSLLAFGTACWLAYGLLRRDPVIIAANLVTMLLVSYILLRKVRWMLHRRRSSDPT